MLAYSIRMAKHIILKPEERTELEQLIKSGKHAARELTRAQVLLHLDRSRAPYQKQSEVAAAAFVSLGTVHNIKKRYLNEGLKSALHDKPRPGGRVKLDGEVEAQLVKLACSDAPEGHARWTLRLLATRLVELEVVESVSHVAVGEMLKKMNLNLGE